MRKPRAVLDGHIPQNFFETVPEAQIQTPCLPNVLIQDPGRSSNQVDAIVYCNLQYSGFPVAPSGSQCFFQGTNLSSSGHRPCPPPCRWMLPLLGRAKLVRVSLHRSILGHGQLEHVGTSRRVGQAQGGDSAGDMDTLDIRVCLKIVYP